MGRQGRALSLHGNSSPVGNLSFPTALLAALAPVTVVAGHYGVGKTTFSLNLALDAAAAGMQVTLADLDVVNPYFRSSEYRRLLEDAGVRLIAPVFAEAGTSLDVPSLTGTLVPAVEQARAAENSLLVIDAGGDDVGATALGRFAHAVDAGPYALLYVANPFRSLTREVGESVEILREIEKKARLRATAVVGNAHLREQTDWSVVARGAAHACELAGAAALPLACVTVPDSLLRQEKPPVNLRIEQAKLYPVRLYVKPPWE